MFLNINLTRCLFLALIGLMCLLVAPRVPAQTDERIAELHLQAALLFKQGNYVDAVPVMEKLVVAEPDSAENQFYLGFALLAKGNTSTDAAAGRAFRVRARAAFVRAKELGSREQLVMIFIATLPADGSMPAFSGNAEVNRLMTSAEASFAQGNLDDALRQYQSALVLDPKNYEAALFSGDVFSQQGDYPNAELWYQKAIAIDPTRETAYRYSATPLMRQKKYELARDRYIEAFISEPYNRLTHMGLGQWGEVTGNQLGHPEIDLPTYNDASGTAEGGDSSPAWVAYARTRTAWRQEKFKRTFPKETTYRHSLAEEADALRSVLALAAADKKVTTLSPTLTNLKKLNDQGLLEAAILLAMPDEGIAQDHPSYLAQHRDLLRQYAQQYVIVPGGK